MIIQPNQASSGEDDFIRLTWWFHTQPINFSFTYSNPRRFTEEEEVMTVIEKAILLFKDEGIAGERFADTVKRLGFEYVNEKLIG